MKTITTNLKYAYVKDIVLLPNIESKETRTIEDSEQTYEVAVYKSRISISYDIKDENGDLVRVAHKEHYSDATENRLSYAEYKAWQVNNEADFIAADKLELVNFTGE